MADDDFRRRRLGDATKARIADLASGWDTPNPDADPAPDPLPDPAPRKKQRTIPPPAPGSPERRAYEAEIIASTADRDDATNELPPRPPTGAHPIIRSDEIDPRYSSPPSAPRTKPPTGQAPLVGDRSRTATGQVPLAGARPRTPTGQAPMLRADDPRATQGGPPPPPRPKAPTGQQPAIASGRTPTGQQSSLRADDPRATQGGPPPPPRPKAPTGQQPAIASGRTPTGQQPAIASGRTPTGQQPAIASGRTPTGQQPNFRADDPRATQSGPPPPPRPKAPTGQQPAIASGRTPTGQQSAIASGRTPTGQQPAMTTGRAHVPTGRHVIISDRARTGTGQHPVAPPGRPVAGQPAAGRDSSSTGRHAVIAERARTATGEVPVVVPPLFGRSKPVTAPPPSSSTGTSPAIPPLPARDTEPVRRVDPTPPALPSPDTEPVARVDETPLPSRPDRNKPISYPPPTPDTEPVPRFDVPLVPSSGEGERRPMSAAPSVSDRSKPVSAPPPLPERSKPLSAAPPVSERSKPVSAAPPGSERSKPTPAPGDRDDRISIGSLDWSVPRAGTAGERADATGTGLVADERSKAPSAPPATAIPVPPLVSSTSVLARDDDTVTDSDAAARAAGRQFPRAGFEGPSDPFATEGRASASDVRPLAAEQRPFATEQRTFAAENRTPPVIVDASLVGEAGARPAPAVAKQTVPTGEFDTNGRTVEDHTTGKRDAAEALLRIPDTITPVEDLLEDDEDAARTPAPVRRAAAPVAATFDRGDATQNAPPDATQIEGFRPTHPTGGTLRASAALRRKRGLWGDVRYVFTAVFGVRQSRRELADLEHRQTVRQTSRRRHLITLGRTAAVMDTFDHVAIGKAREQLATIEDERSKHAGAVAASDAELERVRRERDNSFKQHAIAVSETDAELVELAKKLEPVEKEAQAARKRASDLRDELRRIEKQIADTEAKLVSVRAEKTDKAAIQADIATFRANKEAVMRDEPAIAAELDALNPRIAAMEATRSSLEKKKEDLHKAEQDDQKRTMELLEAIGAKRKVVERAAADAEAARDNALFELGEQLYVDRPGQLSAQLSPIDRIDLEIGEDERRAMELKEILSNIDRWKFARGLAMIILALGAAGSLAWLVLASV